MASRLPALVRFGLGGVLSSTVVLGLSALLAETGTAGTRVAPAFGLAASLAVNFAVMRRLVFRGTQRPLARQAVEYLASSGVFRGLEYLGFLVVDSVLHLHYLVALVVVLGTSFGLKFVWYEGFVFRRSAG